MPKFIRPPANETHHTMIGVGQQHIEAEADGRFDVRGVNPQDYQALMDAGWLNADLKTDPSTGPATAAPPARPTNPTLALLADFDGLEDDKLVEMLGLRGITVPIELGHDKLVEIALEEALKQRREQAEQDAIKAAEDKASKPNDTSETAADADATGGANPVRSEPTEVKKTDGDVAGAAAGSASAPAPEAAKVKTGKAAKGSTFTQDNAPKTGE